MFEDAIDYAIENYGDPVTIHIRTPRTEKVETPPGSGTFIDVVVKDNEHQIVYDTEKKDVTCRLLTKETYQSVEHLQMHSETTKSDYSLAKFMKKHAEYLNKNNRVEHTDKSGVTKIYDIIDVNEVQSCFEVILS